MNLKLKNNGSFEAVLGQIFFVPSQELEAESIYSNNNSDCCFLNFPIDNSVKVIPYFELIPQDECDELKKVIDEILSMDLWTGDYLGKVMIVALKLLQTNNVLIINAAGLTLDSAKIAFSFFSKYLLNHRFQTVILVGDFSIEDFNTRNY